jgi:hypothetical protein
MKRQALDHTKMDLLMRKLKIRRCMAVGILESLWHLTAREAPRGDIGKLSNERIAIGIDWGGDADRLVEALVDSEWVDHIGDEPPSTGHRRSARPIDASPSASSADRCQSAGHQRLLIHDWKEHCDESIKKYLKRNNIAFACRDMSRNVLDMSRLPVPVPVPEDQNQIPEGQRDESRHGPPPPIPPSAPSWKNDESYTPFVVVWREVQTVTGKPLIDEDFAEAYFRWKQLDLEQRPMAIQHVRERLDLGVWAGNTDPQYIPMPKRYLGSEYKRPVVPPKPHFSPADRRRLESMPQRPEKPTREQEIEALRDLANSQHETEEIRAQCRSRLNELERALA